MELFLTGDIWSKVNNLLIKQKGLIACIAYVTNQNLKLKKGDTLICDASEYEIKFGSTSAEVIESYFKKGVIIKSNPSLHSKLLLSDNFLVVGSANLSNRSAKTLIETAVVTTSDTLISQAKAFCLNLIEDECTTTLTKLEISRLLKIEVVRKTFKPLTQSRVRDKKFGEKYWYVTVGELSQTAFEKVKDRLEDSTNKVIQESRSSEGNLGNIYYKQKTRFATLATEGDQIMINWHNKNKTRRSILPFATILRIDREKDETIMIYDSSKNFNEISFKKFLSSLSKLDLSKPLQIPRSKEIPKEDAEKLKGLWK